MSSRQVPKKVNRRQFAAALASLTPALMSGAKSLLAAQRAPAVSKASSRPKITHGVSSGDVTEGRAVIWSRADRPSRMIVEISTMESFRNSRRIAGPTVLADTDFAAKLNLSNVPVGQRIFYRVQFQNLENRRILSEPAIGTFQSATDIRKDVTFAWSGDTAGQGYGIDVSRGGMRTYETIRQHRPDFFLHSGDTIYADNPFPSEMMLDDGTVWKNIVTEKTSKVAETLDEFHANFRYNLLDENVRRFNAEIPLFTQWDDHETTNNWYPGEQLLDNDKYRVKSASLLAARAKRAFFNYMPIRNPFPSQERIHRVIPYGPLLSMFFLDLRSFRGPNGENREQEPSWKTSFLSPMQLSWLKRELLACRTTWKIIASDMPIGLIVRDGPNASENATNGDGRPLGREHEIAELLRFIKANRIQNVVWLTADVHFAGSYFYDPNHAQFQDFEPFWEFVSGPLHAGTFGPSKLDNTFGPQQRFASVPEGMKPNRPPSEGRQFFGLVHIDSNTEVLSVTHYNVAGEKLWSTDIEPKHS